MSMMIHVSLKTFPWMSFFFAMHPEPVRDIFEKSIGYKAGKK
jgi:hypothetical protein